MFQIFGNDAQKILHAAQRIEQWGPDIIDINMGCSTRKVSGRGQNSTLKEDYRQIYDKMLPGDEMTLTVEPHPIPLGKDADGNWRVGNTRVLLDLVVYAFNTGRTPEEIVQSYDTLRLEEVYSVIAYYLAHRDEIDAYLHQREQEADLLWKDIRNRSDYQDFRNRLLARKSEGHL